MKDNQSDCRRVDIGLHERVGRTLTFIRNLESGGVEIAVLA